MPHVPFVQLVTVVIQVQLQHVPTGSTVTVVTAPVTAVLPGTSAPSLTYHPLSVVQGSILGARRDNNPVLTVLQDQSVQTQRKLSMYLRIEDNIDHYLLLLWEEKVILSSAAHL